MSSHTSKIADMLSNTKKRGDFGEMTIERWLDAAGLQKGIHYDTQVSLAGGTSRPDFIINLPEDRCIILDSKTPLAKLTQAFDDDIGEEAQSELLKEHRKAIEKHITDLGNRDYSAVMNNMSNMPAVIDYTIMIVPEYALAPVMDTELINFAQIHKVILATPSMIVLIASVIHMIWKQRGMSQSIKDVITKAAALDIAVDKFSEKYDSVGTAINTLSSRYNKSNDIFDKQVIPLTSELSVASDVAVGELDDGDNDSDNDANNQRIT